MRRVKGVSKNAIILVAGILAGLFVFYYILSSPLTADAAADLSPVSLFIPEKPPSSEQVVDLSLGSQPEVNEEIGAINENLSPVSTSNVLTGGQLQRLQNASRVYVAPTQADSIQMARSLNIVKEGGDPTNICGPLSIAILRDAGIVDPYIKISRFLASQSK